ncbi:MAG TPA: sigma-70 family RNA polymerase sigma factor [Polyangiaceae bacterium]|nr:sigma-70 family RNA polymerase sigma factor [Polyangiaceae bacterium]
MDRGYELALAFCAAAQLGEADPDLALIEAELQVRWEAARSAWPELELEIWDFVRHLGRASAAGVLPPLANTADLALALSCARGQTRAIAIFHRAYGEVISRVLSRRGANAGLAEDAAQLVHERLLVGSAAVPPKIWEYRGQGPLRSWVSTAAATTLLQLRRSADRRREHSVEEDNSGELVAELDPELGYLKERYKTHVHDAIVAALGQLGDRERTLLRLHLGQRMSIDQLGAMYRVNRATAARWLAAARAFLVERARGELKTRLRISDSECNSIVALVRSQLDVSILQHLS